VELHEALAHIEEIRSRVAASESFHGFRALPIALTGALAVLAALAQPMIVPDPQTMLRDYLALWVGVAFLALATAAFGVVAKLQESGEVLAHALTRLVIGQFAPSLVAGGLMTLILARHSPDACWMLPGLWQVLFSLGVFASCRLLPRAIVAVAVFYLAAGLYHLSFGPGSRSLEPWCMGAVFGCGQTAFAAVLYWNLEREHDS
jgi:hypothetical protein